MGEMAKFPYLTGRKGTRNLYYKRLVPLELRAEGRPEQMAVPEDSRSKGG
jgi:hypothetical protein